MSDDNHIVKLPIMQRLLSTKNIKFICIFLMCAGSIGLSLLSEFLKVNVVEGVFGSQDYWYKTLIASIRNLVFLFGLFWASMILSERNLSNLYSALLNFSIAVLEAGASLYFGKYLDLINRGKKIEAYKEKLQSEYNNPKTAQKRLDTIKQIFALTSDELWNGVEKKDIDFVFGGIKYMNIPYVRVTEPYLFSGYTKAKKPLGDTYTPFYSAFRVFPPFAIITILMASFYSFLPEFLEADRLAYIMAVINLILLLGNGITGWITAEYIINVEKRAFLEYRVSVAYGFLGHEICPKNLTIQQK